MPSTIVEINAQAKCLKRYPDQRMTNKLQCKDNNNFINDKDMAEELKKALTERFEHLSNSVDCDEQIKDALLKAYLAGGEYGYEIGIDEAKGFMSKCIWGRCTDKFHANDNK